MIPCFIFDFLITNNQKIKLFLSIAVDSCFHHKFCRSVENHGCDVMAVNRYAARRAGIDGAPAARSCVDVYDCCAEESFVVLVSIGVVLAYVDGYHVDT